MMQSTEAKTGLFPSAALNLFLDSLSLWTPSLKHTLGPCARDFLNLLQKVAASSQIVFISYRFQGESQLSIREWSM